jgi:hypothetical protein
MLDSDQLAFAATFLKLRTVFSLRGDKAELQQISGLYFKVLRRHPLAAVEAGAESWLQTGARFPKPGEWLKAIPRGQTGTLAEMNADEAREYHRAVALHYQDEPCRCLNCVAAGVTHRFLRYVPETDDNDRDVRMRLGEKVVTRGHWAHGEELARWYAARDEYLALKRTTKPHAMPAAEVQTHPLTGQPFDARTDTVLESEW